MMSDLPTLHVHVDGRLNCTVTDERGEAVPQFRGKYREKGPLIAQYADGELEADRFLVVYWHVPLAFKDTDLDPRTFYKQRPVEA